MEMAQLMHLPTPYSYNSNIINTILLATSSNWTYDDEDPSTTVSPASRSGDDSAAGVVVKVAYLVLLSVTIVLGNVLVIVSVVNVDDMHRTTNYLLVSLATADLMVGVFTVPLFITWLVRHDVFLQAGMCDVVLLSCLFVTVASQLNVIAVTVERYVAVCHPFLHRSVLANSPEVVKAAIGLVWLLSVAVTGLASLAGRGDSGQRCSYYNYFNTTFLLASVLAGVFVPFAIIIALNARIVAKAHASSLFKQTAGGWRGKGGDNRGNYSTRRSSVFVSNRRTPSSTSSDSSNTSTTPNTNRRTSSCGTATTPSRTPSCTSSGSTTTNKRRSPCGPYLTKTPSSKAVSRSRSTCSSVSVTSRGRRRLSLVQAVSSKATRTVVLLCLLYLLAWTPYFAVVLIHAACSHCRLAQALDLILLLAFANSAWNPVLYALSNRMFRRAYRHILSRLCRCCYYRRRHHRQPRYEQAMVRRNSCHPLTSRPSTP